MTLTIPTCIECGSRAEIVGGSRIYPHRPDLYQKKFWLCGCGAYVGCHPGTREPLGSPAGPETRRARSAAHAAFDPLWRSGQMRRKAAYAWLSQALGVERNDCHIGMMDQDTAKRVVQLVTYRKEAHD